MKVKWIIMAVGLVVIAAVTYWGAYRLMVARMMPMVVTVLPTYYYPQYRFGGQFSDRFFGPAHMLDIRLRESYWSFGAVTYAPRLPKGSPPAFYRLGSPTNEWKRNGQTSPNHTSDGIRQPADGLPKPSM